MIEYERSMYREIPGYIRMFDSREREFVIASKKHTVFDPGPWAVSHWATSL